MTYNDFLNYARTKPASESFEYMSNRNCAYAQFLRDTGICASPNVGGDRWLPGGVMIDERITCLDLPSSQRPLEAKTFGELVSRLIKTAARRAADWLEANPTNHLARTLATDASGHAVSPTSPAAACFCALGRLAHELDFREGRDYSIYEQFGQLRIDYDAIYDANDKDSPLPYREHTRLIHPAHPEQGIQALRNL